MRLYVGTYSLPILFGTGEIVQGRGEGIYLLELNLENGGCNVVGLAAEADNPSFLALDSAKQRLYAVNELKEFEGGQQGAVSAFAVRLDGGLNYLNSRPTEGQDPCHIIVTANGKNILVANFMTGSVYGCVLDNDGRLSGNNSFVQHEGHSVDKKRQTGPHAHSFIQSPDRQYFFVPDLGLDQVLIYRLTKDGSLAKAGCYHCKPGRGPRFGEFHPNGRWFYLINELESSVTVTEYNSTLGLKEIQTVSTVSKEAPPNTCADIHITPNGQYLYASNRGDDSIAIFRIEEDTGCLTPLGHVPSGGCTPRQFAIVGKAKYLCVCNQDSDNIAVFSIGKDGSLALVDTVLVPTPVCVIEA